MSSLVPSKLKTWLRTFRYSNLFLILVSIVSSVVLAVYVFGVGNLIAHQPESNAIEQTALYVASDMSKVTVASDSFGLVGLRDIASDEYSAAVGRPVAGRVTGINAIYAVLRLDAFIARELHHPVINSLLSKDFASARDVEKELATRLFKAVEKRAIQSEGPGEFFGLHGLGLKDQDKAGLATNFIYERAYRNLAKALAVHDSKLVDFKIKLGFVRSRKAVSGVQAASLKSGDSSQIYSGEFESTSIDENGQYRPGVPVSVPGFEPIMFTPLMNTGDVDVLDPDDFVQDSRLSAPSAVLVEASWDSRPVGHRNIPLRIRNRTACAAIGPKPLPMPPAALVINFPHGICSLFHSVRDILFFENWKGSGAWRQAVVGELPNQGSLAVTQVPESKYASPGDALAVIIYHWMRLLEPSSSAKNCIAILSSPWNLSVALNENSVSQVPGTLRAAPVNSVLAKDSDARSSVLLDQSSPEGQGRTALKKLFDKPDISGRSDVITAPSSALPLFVDKFGRLNLAGSRAFNPKMVQGFLSAVYDTNLAAIESLWVANLMSSKFSAQRPEFEQSVLIEKQELNSINNRINRLSNKAPGEAGSLAPVPKENLRQIALLKEKVQALEDSIAKKEREIKRLNKITVLSSIAQDNARATADSTYRLSAHALTLCRNGIEPLDNEGNAYLVNRQTCFFASRKPLSESDILEAAEPDGAPESPVDNTSAKCWLNRSMNASEDVEVLFKNRDPNYDPLASKVKSLIRQQLYLPSFTPVCIVLDSQAVIRGKPVPICYSSYPFFGIFVPKGQLIYYCQRAAETGASPRVFWSVLIRDLVACKSEGATGIPVNSTEEDWCKKRGTAVGLCPGLACEFQLRTPLPDLSNFPTGSSVTNESGERVPQVPPVPADML
jgi:hypothetical protein